MERILFSWVGRADLDCASGKKGDQIGALAAIVETAGPFQRLVVLSTYSPAENRYYLQWLAARGHLHVELREPTLSSPVDLREIFEVVRKAIDEIAPDRRQLELAYNVASGTPAMSAIWMLVGMSSHPARLWRSSVEAGVEEVVVPFDVSAEYLPEIEACRDRRTLHRVQAGPGDHSGFDGIVCRGRSMRACIDDAKFYSARDLPVLIQGETGTGKELFARAIHRASARRGKRFVPVNCGAIPAELIEPELFGHARGAFSGAGAARGGLFEAADGGVLFLDELGELSLAAQVKLLRVLENGEVRRVGATRATRVDVRVVAATHRNLGEMVEEERFREDLYYRLAVLLLDLPPLREREECMGALIDHALNKINLELGEGAGGMVWRLAPAARNRLIRHDWPGNFRELNNVVTRAAYQTPGERIDLRTVERVLAARVGRRSDTVLGKPLGHGFDINNLLDAVRRHYLERALGETQGNAAGAAKLLGLSPRNCLLWKKNYLGGGQK